MTPQGTIFDPVRANSSRLAEERAALQAVLASSAFEKKPRLANLLTYICERYFEGDAESIKEYSIAVDVYGRPQTFDQATDSIVRVEVFRLRKKLREYYEGEGADQSIEIAVATGHYRPQFIEREAQGGRQIGLPDSPPIETPPISECAADAEEHSWTPETAQDQPQNDLFFHESPPERVERRPFRWWKFLAIGAVLTVLAAAASTVWLLHRSRHGNTDLALPAFSPAIPSLASGPEVRIRCGYSRPIFKDEEGNIWSGDRYFSGGFVTEFPNQHIARTRSPELYLTARTGVFSYKIPLAPGVYELRLHFAETSYSPASTLGGGENSRVFDIQLNGRPLLRQFDIVSDGGANTADIRVFRDISPDKDGYLRLDFTATLGLPMINAIEIVPGLRHRMRPIRMVAQNSFFVDKSGNLWMPDAYFSSGQLAADKLAVAGTADPGLFAGERYGNFNYALPVDGASFKVTLYFSEKYWGSDVSKKGGVGSRVFDVFCNGVALTRKLDILKEAGSGRALTKTYHGLQPNAQGKLILSFIPDVNYASVDAVEVEEETP